MGLAFDANFPREEGRARVSRAVGLEGAQLPDELGCGVLEGQLPFGHLDPLELLGREVPRKELPRGLAELFEAGLRDRAPGGLVVTAELEEERGEAREILVERDSRNAPTGADRAASVEAEEEDRPVKFARQPGSGDSEDAPMPPGIAFDDRRRAGAACALDALARLPDDEALDRLALGVSIRELPRQLAGAEDLPLLEQREGELRRVEAPRRVQARRDAKGDLLGVGRDAPRDPGLGEERPQSRSHRRRERRETEGRDHAVLPGQGDEVGDRPQAGHPQERLGRQAPTRAPGKRLRELEGDPAGGQVRERIRAARLLRVDDDGAGGKLGRHEVMVRHDHLDTGRAGAGDPFDGGDAAVHRHDHRGPLLLDHAADGLGLEAVSVAEAMRNERSGVGPGAPEGRAQLGHRRDAVDVVVAEDDHAPAGRRRRGQQVGGFSHPFHRERVVEGAGVGPQKSPRLSLLAHAAPEEQRGHGRRHVRRRREGRRLRRGRRHAPDRHGSELPGVPRQTVSDFTPRRPSRSARPLGTSGSGAPASPRG